MKHPLITHLIHASGGGEGGWGGPGTLCVLAVGHMQRLFLPVADSCWDGQRQPPDICGWMVGR